jgi:hypothetical protein
MSPQPKTKPSRLWWLAYPIAVPVMAIVNLLSGRGNVSAHKTFVDGMKVIMILFLLTGCAPVVAIKETLPSPLSVASITPRLAKSSLAAATTKKFISTVTNAPADANHLYELHFTTLATPLTPPAEVGSGYMADPLNYYPLNRDNLEGVGFDKRPKNIYVSHDLITWTLATSNPIASAFFWSDNSPVCFFRVGNNKPANVSVEKLCNITIINRAF